MSEAQERGLDRDRFGCPQWHLEVSVMGMHGIIYSVIREEKPRTEL